MANSTPSPLEQELDEVLRHYTNEVVSAHNFGANYVPTELVDESVAAILALIARHDAEVREAAEVALARKVLAVSSGVHKARGITQAKRLKSLTNEMMKIIPDTFGITEIQDVLPPGAGEGEV